MNSSNTLSNIKMARAANAGRGKGGKDGGRAGRGYGGQGRGTSGTIPRKATELGACKELEGLAPAIKVKMEIR